MSCQPRQRRFFSPDRAPGVCAGPQKRRIRGRLRGAAPPYRAPGPEPSLCESCSEIPPADRIAGSFAPPCGAGEAADAARTPRSPPAFRPLPGGAFSYHILRRNPLLLCSSHIFSLFKGLTVNFGWFTIMSNILNLLNWQDNSLYYNSPPGISRRSAAF